MEPMMRIYQAPSHVRTDTEAYKALVAEYEQSLSGFDKQTLQKAWAEVKDEHKTWIWPHPQVLRDACKKHARTVEATPDQMLSGLHPWKQKDEAARTLAREFMKHFDHGILMQRAREEGYANDLSQYAWNMAQFQAAIIAGVKNKGYHWPVYKFHPNDSQNTIKARCYAFEDFCKKQAVTGDIAIEVPNEAIKAWKGAVAA